MQDPMLAHNLAPILPYIVEGVTDIMINTPGSVTLTYWDKEKEVKEDPLLTHDRLIAMVRYFASQNGQYFDQNHPILSLTLPGGHRMQVVSSIYVEGAFTIAIRLHQLRNFSLGDFYFTKKDRKALLEVIRAKQTLLVSGGTGVGKTSLLNCLIPYIDSKERIISIEGVRELTVPHHDYVALLYPEHGGDVAKVDAEELLFASLRLNPDRIITSEIRKDNASFFYRAINTGHEGALATIHANDTKEALYAIAEYMVQDGCAKMESIPFLVRNLQRRIGAVVQLERKDGLVKGKVELIIVADIISL